MQKVMAAGWLRTKEDMVVEEWAPAVWGQPPTLEEPVQQPTVAPSNQTASNVTYSQRWPEARVAAVESLWGAGYVSPGGPDETLRLTKPLGLDANSTLIVLGGGIGGPALTVTSSFKSWVTSLEADPVLAAVAEARRPSLDTSKRITMQGWQRDRPAFKHAQRQPCAVAGGHARCAAGAGDQGSGRCHAAAGPHRHDRAGRRQAYAGRRP